MFEQSELLDFEGFRNILFNSKVVSLLEVERSPFTDLNKIKFRLRKDEIIVWTGGEIIVYEIKFSER
jgi:hypothetical protein